MKKILLCISLASCLVLLTFYNSFGQNPEVRNFLTNTVSEADLAEMILSAEEWHPFPLYAEREEWENLSGEVKDTLVARGEAALTYTWPTLPATLYMQFARNGNRSNYEKVCFDRREYLSDLVLAEMVEGKGRFIDQIINGVWAICEESSWCIPAHLYGQKDGGTALPVLNENVVDLFAAETGTLLSWTYYLLKDKLDEATPIVSERIVHEIDTRLISPNLERDDFWWMGNIPDRHLNNWTPWIVSNWLTAVLLVEDDSHRKAKSIYKAITSLDKFLNQYPEDGGCDEGPGYWSRAGASLLDCLDLLYTASNEQIDIFEQPLVENIGTYIYKAYISEPYYINFADAPAMVDLSEDIVFRYGERIQNETMKEFAAFVTKQKNFSGYYPGTWMGRRIYSLFSYDQVKNYKGSEPLISDFWLPDIQVYGARSEANSREGLYLAGKGGHNAESHNHNDVGNYIVYCNGLPVIIDVGVEVYRKETFSDQRYSIWTMQSQYHTLPTINGTMQQVGREFSAKDVDFKVSDREAVFSLDLAGAYPQEANVEKWVRTVDFKRKKLIKVTEDYALSKVNGETYLTFITPCLVKATEGKITFESNFDEDLAEPFTVSLDFSGEEMEVVTEEIKIDDDRLFPIWGGMLYRVKLIMKNPQPKDKLEYTISMD